MTDQQLVDAAVEAAKRAYAPYSAFPVGAALLTETGDVYTGCNVENASYGLTICAERVAVCRAVAEGQRRFRTIAVVSQTGATLCGACRQFLAEFGQDLHVLIGRLDGTFSSTTLKQLLPFAFGSNDLDAVAGDPDSA